MDTMEMTKIVGGLSGALLVYLLVSWGAESLYHVGSEGGEGEVVSGYPIEVDLVAGEAGAAEAGPTFEELMAVADLAKGAKLFSKCKACHKVEAGVNGTGPTLFGVVDRAIASVPGFNYSAALSGLGGNWETARLNHFLTKPGAYAKGTKMTFAGLKKAKDRANLISFLQTIK